MRLTYRVFAKIFSLKPKKQLTKIAFNLGETKTKKKP